MTHCTTQGRTKMGIPCIVKNGALSECYTGTFPPKQMLSSLSLLQICMEIGENSQAPIKMRAMNPDPSGMKFINHNQLSIWKALFSLRDVRTEESLMACSHDAMFSNCDLAFLLQLFGCMGIQLSVHIVQFR